MRWSGPERKVPSVSSLPTSQKPKERRAARGAAPSPRALARGALRLQNLSCSCAPALLRNARALQGAELAPDCQVSTSRAAAPRAARPLELQRRQQHIGALSPPHAMRSSARSIEPY